MSSSGAISHCSWQSAPPTGAVATVQMSFQIALQGEFNATYEFKGDKNYRRFGQCVDMAFAANVAPGNVVVP